MFGMFDDNCFSESTDDDFNDQGYLWLCAACEHQPTFETIYELFNHKKTHQSAINEISVAENNFNDNFKKSDLKTVSDSDEGDFGDLNPSSPFSPSEDIPLSNLVSNEHSLDSKENKESIRKSYTQGDFLKESTISVTKLNKHSNSKISSESENDVIKVDKEEEIKQDDVSEKVYEGKENIKTAEKESTSKSKVKHLCKICNTEFQSRVKLSLHKKTHLFQDTGCYKCETCGKLCSKYDNFTRHLTIHLSNRKKTHQCTQCLASFYNLADLKRHLVLHLAVKPFRCEHCGEGFLRQDNLLIHEYKHTGIQYKKFACKDCDKVLNSPSALVMHSKTHSVKTVFCPEPGCKFSCYLQSQLRQHLRKHSGEKPFQCAKCGRCFARSNDMKNHIMNIHENIKPYKCSSCPKKFALIGNLKIHSITHTNERPFLCAQCGKSFNQSSTLRKHSIIMHNPWRPEKTKKSKKAGFSCEIEEGGKKSRGKSKDLNEKVKEKKEMRNSNMVIYVIE